MSNLAEYREIKNRWTGNGQDDAPQLAPVDPAALHGVPVPERQWLVPDWIPMARVTGLYGAGGEGKTLLAQMLATSCAIGETWLGMEVRQCRSLLLFCEDDRDEMHRRQENINRAYRCDYCDLGAMRWLPRLGEDNALMTFNAGLPSATKLFDQVLSIARGHGARLIIADTLADVFSGNENDRGQARAFAQQALGRLARETQGAVIALAHPSRAGMNSGTGESGSTAWIGTFRSQLYLSTPKQEDKEGEPLDRDRRALTRRKSNTARRDDEIPLRWEDGVFLALSPPSGSVGWIERQACERKFLGLLQEFDQAGRRLSDTSKAGDNWAPRAFTRHPDRGPYKLKDFAAAQENLFATNAIAMTGQGRNRRMAVTEAGARLLVSP